MKNPHSFNRNGGLSLVLLPGFHEPGIVLKDTIERKGGYEDQYDTPVDIVTPWFGERPSEESYAKQSSKHVKDHDCFIICSGPGTDARIVRLLYTIGYLRKRGASRITVVMGYVFHGRSDKDEGKEELAIPPILLDAFEGVGKGKLSRIICADAHAPQVSMAGNLCNITEIRLGQKLVSQVLDDANKAGFEKICFAFPDDNAHKRLEPSIRAVEKRRGKKYPVVKVDSRRLDDETKVIDSVYRDTFALLPETLVIQFDDEVATGTTQMNAAYYFAEHFGVVNNWAAVTHGVLCGNAVERFTAPGCPIARLYVTDTIPVHARDELRPLFDSGKLHVVSWLRDLGLIIYDEHWGESIRDERH